LFNASTIPWTTAVQLIADSAGASADTEMQARAHRSLRASFQHFGGRYNWDFLRGESTPARVIGPFTVTGVSASAGQVSAAAPAGHGFAVDDIVLASGFLTGNRITATAASGFGFAAAVTGFTAGVTVITATGVRDYYDVPSTYRRIYTVRLLGAAKSLGYATRRTYDRFVTDEFSAGTPESYDLFSVGGLGKIRLLPPPASSDVLLVRHSRRFSLASASGVTSSLDIPEDYESYVIAWAKWHFLTDKSDSAERATTWLSLAQEGLKTMLQEQTLIPDQDLGFTPAHAVPYTGGDNSTRFVPWDT
jgi:hypothetical protein